MKPHIKNLPGDSVTYRFATGVIVKLGRPTQLIGLLGHQSMLSLVSQNIIIHPIHRIQVLCSQQLWGLHATIMFRCHHIFPLLMDLLRVQLIRLRLQSLIRIIANQYIQRVPIIIPITRTTVRIPISFSKYLVVFTTTRHIHHIMLQGVLAGDKTIRTLDMVLAPSGKESLCSMFTTFSTQHPVVLEISKICSSMPIVLLLIQQLSAQSRGFVHENTISSSRASESRCNGPLPSPPLSSGQYCLDNKTHSSQFKDNYFTGTSTSPAEYYGREPHTSSRIVQLQDTAP
ncbi:hypothetical protein BDQ17DRAFT_710791 [Cyathus striatus]|nr:hypothetical protein BDQ17DRAFT_710791 [Cyathus striatus]